MYLLLQEVDLAGFRTFLNTFLEVDTPEELCRHLFLSFVRRSPAPQSHPGASAGALGATASQGPAGSSGTQHSHWLDGKAMKVGLKLRSWTLP